MDANIVNLLLQVPILGVFIWWSIRVSKGFTDALDRRDELYEKRNAALVEAITCNTAQVRELTEIVIRMDERREERPAANEPKTAKRPVRQQ
jgi:Na+/phosphate symporter